MYCIKCNKEYPAECRFCTFCGSVLAENPQTEEDDGPYLLIDDDTIEDDGISFDDFPDFEDDDLNSEEDMSFEDDGISFDDFPDFEDDDINSEEDMSFEDDDFSFEDESTCEEEIIPEEETDHTEIGIHKQETYYIRSEDITNKSGTKRYINVEINTMDRFKFCPDFTIDYNTEGKGFTYNDHVIMAFYRSETDSLGLYKIKLGGKKVTALYTVEIKKYDPDSIAFYEADDGRFILSCSQIILFFTLNKKPEYQCFNITNEYSGITALYSGNRMLLYVEDEYRKHNDAVWFDGEKDINIFKTEWVNNGEWICRNHAYNYLFNNAPHALENNYPYPEIRFTDRKRVEFNFDKYDSDISKYYLERDGRIFFEDTEILREDRLQIDNDVTGYEDIVERMLTILKYDSFNSELLEKNHDPIKNIKCFHLYRKSRTFIDASVIYEDTSVWNGKYSRRVKYDIDNNIISVYKMNSDNAERIISEPNKLLSNFKLYSENKKLQEKFKDRLGWFNDVKDKVFGSCYIAFVSGFVADKSIYFSYPPKNSSGVQIPDSDISGLFVFCKAEKYAYPAALRIMLDSQAVYGYCLTEDDRNIICENKMLWKDWYISRRKNFEFLFRCSDRKLFTAERLPLPVISSSEVIFGIENTKEELRSSGINASAPNTIHNGTNEAWGGEGIAKLPPCRLSYELSVFGENIGSEVIECTGYTLCPKGLLMAADNVIYLMTDLCSPKKEFLRINEKIMSIICSDRYLFVTAYNEDIKSETHSYVAGQSDYWREGELITSTTVTVKRVPVTHIYDLRTNTRIGSVDRLGSVIEIIQSLDRYAISFMEKSQSNGVQKKSYNISSSPDRIVSELKRITENLT